ncbi:MAG: prepilin peptidase [Lachnospiraceae bacterium]|nr:prepilin peptidase [Lachnospiraceae bacterium]
MVDAKDILLIFTAGIFFGSFLKRCLCIVWQIKIEERYPFVECANGLLYVLVLLAAGWTVKGGFFCICTSVLLAVGIADQKTFEIPIGCNMLIGILGGIHLLLDLPHWQEYLAGLFAASGLLGAAYFLSKGKGIGGGDIKLMAAAGLLLGWENIMLALFIGSVSGAVIHILRMRFQRKDRVLAFGPYLAFGIFTAMLCGEGF